MHGEIACFESYLLFTLMQVCAFLLSISKFEGGSALKTPTRGRLAGPLVKNKYFPWLANAFHRGGVWPCWICSVSVMKAVAFEFEADRMDIMEDDVRENSKENNSSAATTRAHGFPRVAKFCSTEVKIYG